MIDDLLLQDHTYLDEDDECYYLMEYTSHMGFTYSPANSLISNLKKPPSQKGANHYKYKGYAINEVANYYGQIFSGHYLDGHTLMPMPPSKAKDHPEYDDRMLQIVNGIYDDFEPDIRELIITSESREASHVCEHRPTPHTLMQSMELNDPLDDPAPNHIVIFDDVITTGAHFKACKQMLSQRFPNAQITGVFIARRVFAEEDWE